jgi:hypothetical protein
LRKIKYQNTIFLSFIQTYASLLAEEMPYIVIYKVFYTKGMFEKYISKLFSLKLPSDFKRDYLQPKFHLQYANKSPWPIHIVFIKTCFNYENMLVTVLDCCFEF